MGIRLGFHHHAPEQAAIRLAFHQPAANQLRSNNFCGAAEEGLRQGWEILGDEGGGYGRGCWSPFILLTTVKLLSFQ